MLSQALYWTRKLADQPAREGWFWKTREDWRNETGLSRREQDSARRALKALGLWQECRLGMPAKVWFRVNLDALGRLLAPEQFAGWDWRNERLILGLLGKPFLFYRNLSDVTGAATAAVLLSNFLAQERHAAREGSSLAAWRTYRFEGLRQYLGFSAHELDTARLHLRTTGIVDERRIGVPPRVEWRIQLDRLIGLLAAVKRRPEATQLELRQSYYPPATRMVVQFSGNVPSSLPESGKQDCRNPANKFAENRQTDFAETYQLDLRIRTDWNSGNVPTRWAESAKSDGRNPGNPIFSTTGLITTPPIRTPERANAPEHGGRGWSEALIWPKALVAEERSWAIKLLSGVPDHAQLLLDELAGQMRSGQSTGKVIGKPLGYLRSLVHGAIAGTFVPSVALQEQARRQATALRQAQQSAATPGTPTQGRPDHIDAGLASLRAMRSSMLSRLNRPGGRE
jgi:hypothetical protein